MARTFADFPRKKSATFPHIREEPHCLENMPTNMAFPGRPAGWATIAAPYNSNRFLIIKIAVPLASARCLSAIRHRFPSVS
jgi:hypothetical protein